jgi:hypothetical protein
MSGKTPPTHKYTTYGRCSGFPLREQNVAVRNWTPDSDEYLVGDIRSRSSIDDGLVDDNVVAFVVGICNDPPFELVEFPMTEAAILFDTETPSDFSLMSWPTARSVLLLWPMDSTIGHPLFQRTERSKLLILNQP